MWYKRLYVSPSTYYKIQYLVGLIKRKTQIISFNLLAARELRALHFCGYGFPASASGGHTTKQGKLVGNVYATR
jgi:hypothetical protein